MQQTGSPFPPRNGPTSPPAPNGDPARPSNANMMKGMTLSNERWNSGSIASPSAPVQALFPTEHFSAGKLVKRALDSISVKIAAARLQLEEGSLTGTPLPMFKEAVSKDNEPQAQEHDSAPVQKLRPRAEVVIVGPDKNSILAIDKGTYLLLPGGGVADGEAPIGAAIRETLEEASRSLLHVVPCETVESIWPDDFAGAAEGFDGERSYFFTAIDGGDAGVKHADNEKFDFIPVETILRRLDELIIDDEQQWAKRNNEARRDAISFVVTSDYRAKKVAAAATIPQVPGVPLTPDQQFVNQLAASAQQNMQEQPPAAPPNPAPSAPIPTPNQAVKNLQQKTAAESDSYAGGAPGYPASRLLPSVTEMGHQQAAEDASKEAARKAAYDEKVRKSTERQPALKGYRPQPAAVGMHKQGDAITLAPRQEHLTFSPAGNLILRRALNRRFDLPQTGTGKPAPYEDPVVYAPEEGVPEEGVHGYRIGMYVGNSPEVPEGYEELPPEDALRELYASMGLAVNKPYRGIDRARARVLLRALRKRKAVDVAPPQEGPVSPSAPITTDAVSAEADDVATVTPE